MAARRSPTICAARRFSISTMSPAAAKGETIDFFVRRVDLPVETVAEGDAGLLQRPWADDGPFVAGPSRLRRDERDAIFSAKRRLPEPASSPGGRRRILIARACRSANPRALAAFRLK